MSKTSKKILSTQKNPPAQTLFIGNLGFETVEDDIRQLFLAHRDKGKQKAKATEGEETAENLPSTDPSGESKAPVEDIFLRKVRMGTFEDSGKCKGFAFVDFTSKENATSALINPQNHRLNGRDLLVEYASADAVRRGGGPRSQEVGDGHRGYKPSKRPKPFIRKGPGTAFAAAQNAERKKQEREEARAARSAPTNSESEPQDNAGDNVGEAKEPRRDWKSSRARSKPGAALALAKRESAAIIPAQGKKIVF
jgi:RNA recognition motif-containing protein